MIRLLKIIIAIFFLSSCTVNQDYYFEKNGSVKMDVGIDMSQLMASLPKTEDNTMDFSKMEDSLKASGVLDSLKEFGVTDVNFSFDTSSYIMAFDMIFKDLKSFTGYMNHERDKTLKPIEIVFGKTMFSVKNCTSLISQDMMEALSNSGGESAEGLGNMSNFLKFQTTYHFPYEINKYKSTSGKGLLSEDKKSISFENTLDELTDTNYNGDITVNFK